LDDADDGPGQVVVDDDVAVLKVLTFGEDVGGDQDVDRVLDSVDVVLGLAGQLVRQWREAAGQAAGLSVSPVAKPTLTTPASVSAAAM
jgi:hypothetical protein